MIVPISRIPPDKLDQVFAEAATAAPAAGPVLLDDSTGKCWNGTKFLKYSSRIRIFQSMENAQRVCDDLNDQVGSPQF